MADGKAKVSRTAERPAGPPVAGLAGEPFLAADIGGTHARVGLVRGRPGRGEVSVLAYHKYRCAEHASLDAIVRDFLDDHAQGPVRYGALACAGYVIDGVVINGILPHIRDFLVRSAFVERFLDKGRMRAFLERVPVRLMEHGQLGVIGAAGWYLDQGRSNTQTPTKAATPRPGPTTANRGDRRE